MAENWFKRKRTEVLVRPCTPQENERLTWWLVGTATRLSDFACAFSTEWVLSIQLPWSSGSSSWSAPQAGTPVTGPTLTEEGGSNLPPQDSGELYPPASRRAEASARDHCRKSLRPVRIDPQQSERAPGWITAWVGITSFFPGRTHYRPISAGRGRAAYRARDQRTDPFHL
jgi:hypothetical protein